MPKAMTCIHEIHGIRNCQECRKTNHKKWAKIYRQTHKKQYREYKRKIKQKFVDMLGGRCQNPKCSTPNGYDRCLSALEFHHINPNDKETKREQITKGFEQKILEGKIQLLCSNCHKEKHHGVD